MPPVEMPRRGRRVALLMVLAALAGALTAAKASAAPMELEYPPPVDWRTVAHERLGFEIAYPANVFMPVASQTVETGRILTTRDGKAKLLIGSFENEAGLSLEDYRAHVLETSYRGAAIDYAPVRRSWFVLSGVRDDVIFYERVSFTCEGRRITSWAILYPVAQRRYYDRILEAVARTFKPSRGAEAC